ncbi:MAG: hypothetical protein V1651_01680, partial [Patescibacteria group bacterium]
MIKFKKSYLFLVAVLVCGIGFLSGGVGVVKASYTILPSTMSIISSTTSSFITITSPNSEEKWKVGETHRIAWSSNNVKKVRVYIFIPNADYLGSGSTNYISDIIPNIGYFDWTIVANALPKSLPANYRIRV